MRYTWVVLLILALALALAACGSKSKSSGDDNGDDAAGCTVSDLCDYAVTTCHSSQWTDLNDCDTNAPADLQQACGNSANDALACMCTCLANTTGCSGYESCVIACFTQFCY